MSLVSAGWFDWLGRITGRPVEECVDSDGGKNYFVQGSCSGEGSGTDSCISTTMLKEYFCMPQDFICIEDYYDCGTGYKCELGKCVKCTPKNCSELGKECGTWSDGCGVNLNCGTCETNFNCVEGVCVIKGMEDYACYVSDGGRNMYEKGILYSYGKKIGEEYCTDSSTAVSEGYCTPNGGATSDDVGVNYGQSIKCPNGCVDGACVADEVCCKSWGIDPNGMEINVKYGFIRKTKCGVSEDFVEGGKEIVDSLYCCLDSDNGFDYYVEGTCSDSSGNFTDLYSGTALIEYYCLNNVCSAAAPFVCEKGEGNACFVENETIEPEEIIQTGCLELNGKNLSVSVPPGKRMNEEGVIYYCNFIDLKFKVAKQKEEFCDDDYECISNDCSAGKCSSVYEEIGKQTELIEEQGSFLRKIWCGILHPVDVTKRNQEGETVENNGWLECYNKGEDCNPVCEDRVCGASVNGCGDENVCGSCEKWEICDSGQCVDYPKLWLGQESEKLLSCDSSGTCINLGGDNGYSRPSIVVYDNLFWIISYGGKLLSCDSSGTCINYGKNEGAYFLHSATVYENKLWLGYADGALWSCDSSGDCTNHGNKGGDIYSMAVYDNKLWLGQEGGILQSCDSSGTCTDYGSKGESYIGPMVVYDDKLWMSHGGTLQSCDSSGTCTNYRVMAYVIHEMVVYDNKLWISLPGGHFFSCDSSGICAYQGDKGDTSYSMAVYNNKLWIGQEDGTLQSCDPSGTCINYGNKGKVIYSMAVFPPEQ